MTEGVDIEGLKDTLEGNVGLSPYEADVYLALVQGGRQSMASVAESSDVPQQRIYDVIQTLQDRGFVEVVDGYPKEAYAIDPSEVLSPIRERLETVETTLDDLHQTVEEVKGGVSVLTSESAIERHLARTVFAAEHSLFILAPSEMLPLLREMLPRENEVQTHLIISGLSKEDASVDNELVNASDSELADVIHRIAWEEAIMISADRRKGMVWVDTDQAHSDESVGYYITNPELALLLDRFLTDSIWPRSTTVVTTDDDEALNFPITYLRMRNCIEDLQTASRTRPLELFELEFDGYETASQNPVHLRGNVIDYYHSSSDNQSNIEIELQDERNTHRTATVGGWKAKEEDYEARRMTLYGPTKSSVGQGLDEETRECLQRCRKTLPASFGGGSFAVGFDGAIDHVKEIVAERTGAETYEPMANFETLQEYLGQASSLARSPFVEWVERATLLGGHSINAGSVASTLGNDVSFVGMYGQPLLEEFKERFPNQQLVSIGEPSRGDLVQFADGKVILTEGGVHSTLDWESLCDVTSVETVRDIFDNVSSVSIGAWATFPRLPTILDGIRTEVWPTLKSPPDEVYLMSGDVNRFADAKFPAGIASIAAFDDVVPVTLFTTWRQVSYYARVFDEETTNSLVRLAESVYKRLGVSRLVVHTPHEAILTTDSGTTVVQTPVVSSSDELKNAEDHFAGGFMAAQMEGLDDGPSLVVANAVANFFTQNEREPTEAELKEVISNYDQIKDTDSDT